MARLREVDLYLETRRKLGGGGPRRGEDGVDELGERDLRAARGECAR